MTTSIISNSRALTTMKFQSRDRGETYILRVEADIQNEPWDVYEALRSKGWDTTDIPPCPKNRKGEAVRFFNKRSKTNPNAGPWRGWTLGERRAYLRQAIGVLRQGGFENVVKEMIA